MIEGSDMQRPDLDLVISLSGRSTLTKILLRPDPELGDAYIDGRLVVETASIRELLEFCFLNFRAPFASKLGGPWLRRLLGLENAWQDRNSRVRARRHVEHHYDLPDSLYREFLDLDRQYSCAYFASPSATLDEAQQAKKDHIVAKLLLETGQHVLDIGCGWGGLALTLAQRGAGAVTGISLSTGQIEIARQRARGAGLDGSVTFLLKDYRDIGGTFDRVVSVGMLEHVGSRHYGQFFGDVSRLLREDGVGLIHSIGSVAEPCSTSPWIRKHIFPGGHVPSLSEILPAIERAGLWVTDVEVLRLHYAETLRHWQSRFQARRDSVAEQLGERFCRMWEFYLAASEMAFRYDGLVVFQVQLSKRVDTVPITRDYMYRGGCGGTDRQALETGARTAGTCKEKADA